MPQDHGGNRRIGGATRTRAALRCVVLGAALVGLVAAASMSTARAADDSTTDDTFLGKFMQKLGLKAPPDQSPDINYSERSPLVVPPTRDLPPPVPGLPPAANWPNDSGAKPPKHVRSKSPPAVPAPAATAAAADGSTPPGQNGQPAPAGQANAPARVPNPTVEKTSIWNPKTWFSREEYATFTAEPPREDLTDPPAGYRVPSPDQPYGVGPDRTKVQLPPTPTVTRQDLPR
jgi:hypothetical protein